jgi:SAM-dependent methyltransferase
MTLDQSPRAKPSDEKKLNLGCGKDTMPGYTNLDWFGLPGVDVVHDLNETPWPFGDSGFTEVRAINVLEHLPDTLQTMNEIWRISKPNAVAIIRVPYWNGYDAVTDPTHVKFFSERTLRFFDVDSIWYGNYSHMYRCKFRIKSLGFYVRIPLFGKYLLIRNRVLRALLSFLATYLNNVICVLEANYEVIK